jgi:hypothetical protein
MIAQFVFTPTESKRLIAKAVARMKSVKKAFKDGIVAMHPSSSTYFIFEELIGSLPSTPVWVTGVIVPRGLCVEAATNIKKIDAATGLKTSIHDPRTYPHTWVIKKGAVQTGMTLNDLMNEMKKGDVYLKGVNAVDVNRRVGVLRASLAEGTIGLMLDAAEKNGFEIICPVGLEKLLPIPLEEASASVKGKKDYSMGAKVNMLTFKPTVIDEIDALRALTGLKAVPFAKGGLGGAEGSVCIVISGPDAEVNSAIELAESVKGSTLPQVKLPDCRDCGLPTCNFPGWEKHWV